MLADCTSIDEVLRAADLAMHRPKELGKDRVVPYTTALSSGIARWLDPNVPRPGGA